MMQDNAFKFTVLIECKNKLYIKRGENWQYTNITSLLSYAGKEIEKEITTNISDVFYKAKCPYCDSDGTIRYAGGEKICDHCGGSGMLGTIDFIDKDIKNQ